MTFKAPICYMIWVRSNLDEIHALAQFVIQRRNPPQIHRDFSMWRWNHFLSEQLTENEGFGQKVTTTNGFRPKNIKTRK